MREKIYNKFGGRCAYCGCEIKPNSFQIDHVIPKSVFVFYVKNSFRVPIQQSHLTEHDAEHEDNKYPACRSCNHYKSAMDLETFRKELGELIGRLNQRITQYKIAKRFGLVAEPKIPKIEFYFEQYSKP